MRGMPAFLFIVGLVLSACAPKFVSMETQSMGVLPASQVVDLARVNPDQQADLYVLLSQEEVRVDQAGWAVQKFSANWSFQQIMDQIRKSQGSVAQKAAVAYWVVQNKYPGQDARFVAGFLTKNPPQTLIGREDSLHPNYWWVEWRSGILDFDGKCAQYGCTPLVAVEDVGGMICYGIRAVDVKGCALLAEWKQ